MTARQRLEREFNPVPSKAVTRSMIQPARDIDSPACSLTQKLVGEKIAEENARNTPCARSSFAYPAIYDM